MTDLENKIYQVITSANGIKGAEIATKLRLEKRDVNSTLSRSVALKALVRQDVATYKWYPISTEANANVRATTNAPIPDLDLKAICNYYLHCISLESSNSVSQFLTSDFALQYAVLNGLEIDPEQDRNALGLLNRINGNRDLKAYLGYPVQIYTIHSRNGASYKKIAPVFMFPVDYSGGRVTITRVPSINMEILKHYTDNHSDALAIELVNLETELGMNTPDTDVEIDELVLRLKTIRQWDWAEEIDPYEIPPVAELDSFEDGIYNRPIIIQAERETYTQGLESELMVLSNMPEENYRGTALYSWIKGTTENSQETETRPLLEVLPLNSEQIQAVETALNSNLTIVTGPPGTGKSQVVTDLLINIAWNGKSALFSSKNNKAVDVVDMRVNGLCKRPILLRIGNNKYASRLAEIVDGLLTSRPNAADRADVEFYMQEYKSTVLELEKLRAEKNTIIEARNNLDCIEQEYCLVRDLTSHCFNAISNVDIGKIETSAELFSSALKQSKKENNGLFERLFWSKVSKKRMEALEKAKDEYNKYAEKYLIPLATSDMADSDAQRLLNDAKQFEDALRVTAEYKESAELFKQLDSFESIDRKLVDIKERLASIAYKLWSKWLTSKTVSFSAEDRSEMANYVAAMRLAGDVDLSHSPELKRQFTKISQKMTNFLQCWAVTSLSAKSRIPFSAGMFDYVIIDEASQCDIASILPLLYRAKRAVIIGDPKQLSHISQISRQQDLMLLQKYSVAPSWSYSVNSLYARASSLVATESIVQLKDHFRSCSDIIEFSNNEFYEGNLRTATDYTTLNTPRNEKPGVRWVNVSGNTVRPLSGSAYNLAEAKAVVLELKRLVEVGYTGSIGVTTPFRKQAEEIKKILENNEPSLNEKLLKNHQFIADTVHKFQGDERDLMIFSTVVANGAPKSTLGFLSNTGNLFNVAITRARAVLVIVGDYGYCHECSVDYLKRFAEYCGRIDSGETTRSVTYALPSGRNYPWVANAEQVSEWEKDFYTALYDAGVKTIPQYSADKYKLDLAIIMDNGRKLDIEVDGAMYHRAWNGELCYRDQLRNQRLFELGWDVKRFWVSQIRDDMQWCIDQVKAWIDTENQS